MENASKALIIAGAILISILLISVGIMVMQSATGMADTVGGKMEQYQIQAFNSDMENYVGTNVRGSIVRNLYASIIASNVSFPSDKVSINGKNTDSDLSTEQGNIKSTGRYTVSIAERNADTGLITNITVTGPGITTGDEG